MQVFSIAGPFNSVVEKRGAMVRIGRRLHQERRLPIVAVFASEAWAASYNPQRPRPWILPEDAPDRREVIQVAGLAVGRRAAAFTTLPIGRDPNDRMVPAGAWADVIASSKVSIPLLAEMFRAFALANQRSLAGHEGQREQDRGKEPPAD